MIYLLHGEDKHQIDQKLKQIKADFLNGKGSDFDIFSFDSRSDIEDIIVATENVGFLSQGKLIVIKNKFSQKGPIGAGNKQNKTEQSQILELIEKIPKEVIMVFVEDTKIHPVRSKLVKTIQENGNVYRFDILRYPQAVSWAQKESLKKGKKLDYDAAQTLIFYSGSDLQLIENELEKLSKYQTENTIQKSDVETLTRPQVSPKIFILIDHIAEKKWQKSYTVLDQMLELGESPLYIHTMIVYQFRNLIIVKQLLDKNISRNLIASKSKLHPFVVQKTISQAENFDFQKLKKIYQKLLKADLILKTKNQDPILILNLLVAAFTR